MATKAITYKPRLANNAFGKALDVNFDKWISRLVPRPCMLVSMGLILAGLCIALLMLLEFIPASLLLGFVGLALIATGGVLVLVYSGEI